MKYVAYSRRRGGGGGGIGSKYRPERTRERIKGQTDRIKADLECGFKQSEIILFIVSNFVQKAGIFYKTKFSSRVALVASIGDTSAA